MTGRLHVQRLSLARLAPNLKSTASLIESPNLAPRQPVSALRLEQGQLTHTPLFWGLTPPWLKVLDHAPHCARAETLSKRAMFQEAFSARRCVIPVSGFYVWKPQARSKQPFLVTHVNRTPLLLGALWCRYHTTLTTFTDSTALINPEGYRRNNRRRKADPYGHRPRKSRHIVYRQPYKSRASKTQRP